MANKKINELDIRTSLSLADLMVVGDPANGYAYKTTLTDLKTLIGGGVTSFNGRVGAVVPAEGDYSLTLLSDVIVTTPTNGQILKYNGTNWVNAAESGAVSSVFGRTGAVVATEGDYTLNLLGDVTITTAAINDILRFNGTAWVNVAGSTSNISEGTNLYYTDTRARASLSLTTTGSSGAATYNSSTGAFNIPNYTLAGLGGFANPMTTLGDVIYGGASGVATRLAGNTTTTKQYLSQTGSGSASAAPAWATIAGGDITGAALTKTDDTNVTLTLGGTPATALLRAASITVGWTGQLAVTRGGTGLSALGTAGQLLRVNTGATALEYFTPTYITGNQTITISGDASGSGTTAISLTLATVNSNVGTFNNVTVNAKGLVTAASNVSYLTAAITSLNGLTASTQTFSNDTNVTITSATSTHTIGWSGQLSVARGGTGASTLTGVVIGNAASAMTAVAGTASQLLRRNAGNTAYEFFSPTFMDNPMTTLGDIIYGGASGAATRLAGNTTTAKQYLSQTGNGTASAAPSWSAIAGADITGAALTKTDDTNVTLTLGGTPATALLRAASLTLGWTGTLSVSRGGTGAGTHTGVIIGNGTSAMTSIASTTALQVFRVNAAGNGYEFATISTSNIYNADGTLTANRTLTQSTFSLTFAGTTSSRFHSNGNWTVGGLVDNGYKLDVQGTARVSGNLTINNGSRLTFGQDSAILIGNNASVPNLPNSRMIAIGENASVTMTINFVGQGVAIGNNSLVQTIGVALGGDAKISNGVSIFTNAQDKTGVFINSTFSGATTNDGSSVLINSTQTNTTSTTRNQSIALNGRISGLSQIAFSSTIPASMPNTLAFGSAGDNNNFGDNETTIQNIYFGSGIQRYRSDNTGGQFTGSGTSYTIHGSGGFGTDFGGGSVTIAGGKGTGTGIGGDVIIATSSAAASGTTLQTLTNRLAVKYNTGQLVLNNYTSSTSFTGTAAGYLAFDSSGNVITVGAVSGNNIYNSDGTLTANRVVTSGGFTLTLNPNTNLEGSLFGNTVRTRNKFNGSYTQPSSVFGDVDLTFDGTALGQSNTVYMGQQMITNSGAGTNIVYGSIIDGETHIRGTGANARIFAANYLQQLRGSTGDISTNSSNAFIGMYVINGHTENVTTTNIYSAGITGYQHIYRNYGGTVNEGYGLRLYSFTGNITTAVQSSTTTNYFGVRLQATVGSSTTTFTHTVSNYYGIYLDAPTVNASGVITNRWGIYAPDSAMRHHIQGNTTFGGTNNDGYKVDVQGTLRSGIHYFNTNAAKLEYSSTNYLLFADQGGVNNALFHTSTSGFDWMMSNSYYFRAIPNNISNNLGCNFQFYEFVGGVGANTISIISDVSGRTGNQATDESIMMLVPNQNAQAGGYAVRPSLFIKAGKSGTWAAADQYAPSGHLYLVGGEPYLGVSNLAGGNVYIYGGKGRGTGIGGDVIIATSIAQTSGSTLQSMADRITVKYNTGQVRFNNYTSAGSFAGSLVAYLGVDSSGNIITTATGGGGGIGGSGNTNYITKWTTDGTAIGNSIIFDNGTKATVGSTTIGRKFTIFTSTADDHLLIAGTTPSVSMTNSITGATLQAKFGLATASNDYSVGSVAGDFVLSSQTGSIIFAINSIEKMRLDNDGSFRATLINNTRIDGRTVSVTDTATLTPDVSTGDVFTISALTQTVTIASTLGTPVNGQKIIIRIKDNGTSRTINYNSIYRASTDLPLPTATTVNKTVYLGFMYNSTDSKWDLIAQLDNF